MKMKFVKTVEANEENIDIYENSLYRLIISSIGKFKFCSVTQLPYKNIEYLPDIFVRRNFGNSLFDTVSIRIIPHGSMEICETEKITQALSKVIESAKEIEEILKQNNIFNIKNSKFIV